MNPDMAQAMDTPCVIWRGAVQSGGYGSCTNGTGGTMLAHRAAWEAAHGPIPDGMHIDHLCMNPRCVNPDHLEAVAPNENARRRGAWQTHCLRGHEYTPETTGRNGHGSRYCKVCAAEQARARRIEVAS